MKTLLERAREYSAKQTFFCGGDNTHNLVRYIYEDAATEQQQIDIENCVKWCERFNIEAEKTGCIERIDVESFRQWITNMIICDENNR